MSTINDDFTRLYAPPSYLINGEFAIPEDKVVEWVQKNNDKSMSFLRSNRGWKSARICMGIYYGDETEKIPSRLSKVSVKKLRRQAREAVENAANIRPNWQHKSRKKQYQGQAEKYDELRDSWFYEQDFYHYLKETLQYAAGGGTGYIWLWPQFDKATEQLEIIPNVLKWDQVLPYHCGTDSNLDGIYGITVHLEVPVPEAHERWPKHINILQPDRNVPSSFTRNWEKVRRVFKGVYDRLKNNKATISQDPYPVTDVYFTWVRDNSINTSGASVRMGTEGAHYSYNVKPGEKLFPYRRFMITSNIGVIYDGPPLYFNCHVPIAAFKFEHVAGEFLGINIIRDGRRLEESNNNILRAFEDSIVGKLNPPLAVSDRIPAPIRAQLTVGARNMIGKVFEYAPSLIKEQILPILPPDTYSLPQGSADLIRFYQEMSDYLMGTADASILTKLNQMPAADTQESFLNSLGSLAKGHSRGIEQSIIRLAKIWLYFAPQVYTTSRIITKLGANGMLKAMDFDPLSIMPTETDPDYSELSYGEKIQQHILQFSIYAAPNSIQERMSQTNKLIMMQLIKMGVEIPNETLYNTFRDDGEYETNKNKWKQEQLEKILLSAMLQKALAAANNQADPMNQLATQLQEMIKGGTNNEGRTPTNNQPPRLEQKMRDGVPDSTIASY